MNPLALLDGLARALLGSRPPAMPVADVEAAIAGILDVIGDALTTVACEARWSGPETYTAEDVADAFAEFGQGMADCAEMFRKGTL